MVRPTSSIEQTVQFAHVWSSLVVPDSIIIHENDTFTTVYGMSYYEWVVGISRADADFPLNRRNGDDVKLFLEPSLSSSARVETAVSCLFTLAVKDPVTYLTVLDAELLVAPSEQEVNELHVMDGEADDGTMGFRVPVESDFGQKLNQIFSARSEYPGYILEIASLITMPNSAFTIVRCTHLAPTTPLEPNSLTCVLYEEERFNFSIRSVNNEEFRTRKDVLNSVSTFFRKFFKSDAGHNTAFMLEPEYSLDVIKTVVIHLITGTFSAPPTWSPEKATQCLTLAAKYRNLEKNKFFRSVEKMCCEGLDKQPLHMIVKWFLISFENDFFRLQHATTALLLTVHKIPFQIYYEAANVDNDRRNAAERLNLDRGAFTTSLLKKLTDLRTGARHVITLEAPQ